MSDTRASREPHLIHVAQASRYLSLDAVRAIAILLVAGHHLAYRVPFNFDDPVARIFRAAGYIGVDLFFALSGFLIVHLLRQTPGPEGTYGFAVRRMARIVPIFMVAIVVFGAGTALHGRWGDLHLLPLTALFLNGWMIPFTGIDGVPFTITWSLSVEVFGYLLLGLAARRSASALKAMLIAMVVGAAAVRTILLLTAALPVETLYFFVPARIDAIAFGGLAAFGLFRTVDARPWAPYVLGGAVAALIVLFRYIPISNWIMPALGYPVFGVIAAAWVSSLFHARSAAPSLFTRILAPIGLYSYFIYLFHLFFIEGINAAAAAAGVSLDFYTALLLLIAVSTTAGAISWRLFEKPIIDRAARHTRRAA